ncbi:MAG: glycosyltransferase family 39 protein [Elusimicrobiota bacterium]|nr:glycosyltransferase family 39 protein [Elusimicrobiota bacterium]
MSETDAPPPEPSTIYAPPTEAENFSTADDGTQPQKPASLLWRIGSILGLAALILFQLIQLAFWIGRENQPPTATASQQMNIARDYIALDALRHPGRLLDYEFKSPVIPIPPLYHLAVATMMKYEESEKAGFYVNALFLALLAVALWGLGRRFSGEWAGLFAAVLLTCAADVQALSREQVPDLALAALVAAGYWAYLASDRFQRKLPSLLFGVLFAAAQLTKWSAFAYFLPVFFLGALALGGKRGRLGAALAFVVVVVLTAPWYRAHWPFLVPRLLEAAFGQDSSTSVLAYLGTTALGLEFPVFLAALGGLVFNQWAKPKPDLLALCAWFCLSFLFWSFLPARDARFLLPALAPLAVLVTGLPFRGVVPGLCVFQLVCAANFGFGVIPRLGLAVPLVPVGIFRSMPILEEDWKIPNILAEVQRSGTTGQEKDYLSIMADHPRFNCATFDWERRKLNIETVQIRYPSKNMGSFSNFVLIKMDAKDVPDLITLKVNPFGSLSMADKPGTPAAPGGKPEAGAWFQQGYQAMQRWTLPDGTQGVVFWRRHVAENPFRERYAMFNYYDDGSLVANNLSIDLGEWDPTLGVHKEVTITAKSISFDGLKATNVRLAMQDLTLLPVKSAGSLVMDGSSGKGVTQSTEDMLLNVRFMRMRRLRILSATVTDKDAEAYLLKHTRIPGVKMTNFSLNKNVAVKAKVLNFLPVTAEASTQLRPDGRGMDVKLTHTTVAGIPIPLGLLLGDRVKMKLAFDLNLPFEVEVSPFTIENGRVRMKEAKEVKEAKEDAP